MSAPDDEGTIVRPPSARRPPMQLGHMLPVGTRLRDYEITGLIGEGGFGIVYLAWDHSLQRRVAVKEYMPSSLVSRVNGSSAIVVKSERHLDTFKAGLRSFVNEARLLARFDHPSLVKVYRFWEENGTAYMVMPYYEGPTLKAALASLGHAPGEDELRAWLTPLLDALAVMHAAHCYHRDIAPDNILLTPGGPLLLDFGAARRVIGDMTHALTVVLKPGYAPIEQYGDVATMAQGAWTDLYALACVVYYAITGKTPISSVERLMGDSMQPLAVLAAGRYSPAFLRAIDAALAVRPQDRPQNERAFRTLLDADRPPEAVVHSRPGSLSVYPPDAVERTESQGDSTLPATLVPEVATQGFERGGSSPASAWVAAEEPLAAGAAPRPSRALAYGLVALLVLGFGVAVVLWMQARVATDAMPAAAPAAVAAPAVAPQTAPPAVVAPVAESEPARAPSPSMQAPVQPSMQAPVQPPLDPPLQPPVQTPVQTPPLPTAQPRSPLPPPATSLPATSPPATPASAVAPRPRREPPPVRREPVETNREPAPTSRPAPSYGGSSGARCSDILQKASLEPLTAEESAYLKRDCR
jgi:hypothetical protein